MRKIAGFWPFNLFAITGSLNHTSWNTASTVSIFKIVKETISKTLAKLNPVTLFLFLILVNAPWYGYAKWDIFKPKILDLINLPMTLGGILNFGAPLLFVCFALRAKYRRHIFTFCRSTLPLKILGIACILWLGLQVVNTLQNEIVFDKFAYRSILNATALAAIFVLLKPLLLTLSTLEKKLLTWGYAFSALIAILLPLISPATSNESLEITPYVIRFIGMNLNPVSLVYSSTFLLILSVWCILMVPVTEKVIGKDTEKTIEKDPAKIPTEATEEQAKAFRKNLILGDRPLVFHPLLLQTILFVISLTGLILSASRTGLLGVLVFIILLRFAPSKSKPAILKHPQIKSRIQWMLLALIAAHLSPNVVAKYDFLRLDTRHFNFLTTRLEKTFRELAETNHSIRSLDLLMNSSGRTDAIEALLESTTFNQEDYLVGHGTGATTRTLAGNFDGVREPHNEVLRTFFDHGLLGLVIMFLFLLIIPMNLSSWIARTSLVIFYLNILTENFFYYSLIGLIPFCTLLFIYDDKLSKLEKDFRSI